MKGQNHLEAEGGGGEVRDINLQQRERGVQGIYKDAVLGRPTCGH